MNQKRPIIHEKDIDELIIRNLRDNKGFAKRFITAGCSIPIEFDVLRVDGQVPHYGVPGSIDIQVRLCNSSRVECGRLLVENKLNSGFTLNQPDRYAASATSLSKSRRPVFSVICAPSEYLEKSQNISPFNTKISYEDLASWLDSDDVDVLSQAILKFEMPYEPDPVPAVADFHDGYRELAAKIAPELIIKPNPNSSNARPEHSRTVYFDAKRSLPNYDFLPTLRFSHQCLDKAALAPSVKIMFEGWAKYEKLLKKEGAKDLAMSGLYIRRAGRRETGSLGLTHDTKKMDNKKPVNQQYDAVVFGIRAATKLRAWMFVNEDVLHRWATAVAESENNEKHINT